MDGKDKQIEELKALVAALTRRIEELELELAKAKKRFFHLIQTTFQRYHQAQGKAEKGLVGERNLAAAANPDTSVNCGNPCPRNGSMKLLTTVSRTNS
jgi:hypothetical protein